MPLTNPRPSRPLLFAWLLCVLFTAGRGWAADATSAPLRVDQQTSACTEPRIVGTPDRLALAWLVANGPQAGIYTRRRTNWTWGSAERITPAAAAPFRDLVVSLDPQQRLWLAFTANLGGERRLFLATQPAADKPFTVKLVEDGQTAPGARHDSDFPALAIDGNGTGLLAWQQADGLGYSIHALRLSATQTTTALGKVSLTHSGLSPQIMAADPPTLAWYVVDDIGTHLQVSQWSTGIWGLAPLDLVTAALPAAQQILLKRAGTGLLGVWAPEAQPGLLAGLAITSGGLQREALNFPAGDATQPSLSISPGAERITAVWRVLADGAQRLCIASILNPAKPGKYIVSTPAQRFAALPDHATVGDWSGVIWTDAAGDGGDGHIYFAEINWMSPAQ